MAVHRRAAATPPPPLPPVNPTANILEARVGCGKHHQGAAGVQDAVEEECERQGRNETNRAPRSNAAAAAARRRSGRRDHTLRYLETPPPNQSAGETQGVIGKRRGARGGSARGGSAGGTVGCDALAHGRASADVTSGLRWSYGVPFYGVPLIAWHFVWCERGHTSGLTSGRAGRGSGAHRRL